MVTVSLSEFIGRSAGKSVGLLSCRATESLWFSWTDETSGKYTAAIFNPCNILLNLSLSNWVYELISSYPTEIGKKMEGTGICREGTHGRTDKRLV